MKRVSLWASFLFGLFITISVIKLMRETPSGNPIETIGVSAILILFAFYPFNFLLLTQHKEGLTSTLEKILQWPFFGKKDKVPTNLGPWWANRLGNAVLLTSFVPFLLILILVWLAKFLSN